MEYRHELIQFSGNLPLKVYIHRIGDVPMHWHQSVEMLYVVEGELIITVDQQQYAMKEDDLVLINANCIHELHAEACVLIALQVKLQTFEKEVNDLKMMRFECNSAKSEDPTQFQQLKKIIFQLLQRNLATQPEAEFMNRALIYQLLHELTTNFVEEKGTNTVNIEKNLNRLRAILTYVQEHYTDAITLEAVARREYLSVAYFSRFFHSHTGMSFGDYVRYLRLNHGIHVLKTTQMTIEKIAQDSGFPNTRSFVNAFKNKYHQYPSQYREKVENSSVSDKEIRSGLNYLTMNTTAYLAKLNDKFEQLNAESKSRSTDLRNKKVKNTVHIPVQLQQSQDIWTPSYKGMMSVGRAKELLNGNVQQVVQKMQKEIGFEYVKFHNIFGDDMMVYDVLPDGSHNYNYVYLDQAIDFLLENHLKPFIQFSFMPSKMAKTPERQIFYSPAVLGPPKEWKYWQDLIVSWVSHCFKRYGKKTVETWLFCVWNEPDITELFGFDSFSTFLELYESSYHAVKKCSSHLRFGGMSTHLISQSGCDLMKEFIGFGREKGCLPDFVNIHFYPMLATELTKPSLVSMQGVSRTQQTMQLMTDAQALNHSLDWLKEILKEEGFSDMPCYISEWNSTPHHRDLINDTCYKSAYIVKNILENQRKVASFAYWLASDLHEEFRFSQEEFHGGLGLFTYQQIPKPAYYAFVFLNQLGEDIIAQGDGYIVTKRDDRYVLLLYNYVHFTSLYASGEHFNLDVVKRDAPFQSREKKQFIFKIQGLEKGEHTFVEKSIHPKSGSAFDAWVEMGAQPLSSQEEVAYLKAQSLPKMVKSKQDIQEDVFEYGVVLEPHEVRLIVII